MRVRIEPGGRVQGEAEVPGDKSIAHRWLILAATARGRSRVTGLPRSLDVLATARALAELSSARTRPPLDALASRPAGEAEGPGLTVDGSVGSGRSAGEVVVEAEGRDALVPPIGPLDCGNSGTTMRLLAGILAAAPFSSVLTGDDSLSGRPMERVAVPLREMGATVETTDGHSPLEVHGSVLRGIRYEVPVPSAQVKGSVLLAGVAAEGETEVVEAVQTRDHTERALETLGASVRHLERGVGVSRFQHGGFEAAVPGDISAAAFLLVAGALTGGTVNVTRVGLNPSRTRFLAVLARMGVRIDERVMGAQLGEPVGELALRSVGDLTGTDVSATELPLVIDEVPVLAAIAAHAAGETRFRGGGELAAKESDRLAGLAQVIRDLGGEAKVEGDDLIVSGGGLPGGSVDAHRDHRMAMAAAVACLRAGSPCEIEGMEWAAVSFPGFVPLLRALGAQIEGV